jgi:YVTN family beta-propeller protein
VAITPNGAYAWVANTGSSTVSVINTASHKVVTTVNVGADPYGVAITPNGFTAYVTNGGSGNVSIVNTVTGHLTTVGVGSDPVGVAITPNGTRFMSRTVCLAPLASSIPRTERSMQPCPLGAIRLERPSSIGG